MGKPKVMISPFAGRRLRKKSNPAILAPLLVYSNMPFGSRITRHLPSLGYSNVQSTSFPDASIHPYFTEVESKVNQRKNGIANLAPTLDTMVPLECLLKWGLKQTVDRVHTQGNGKIQTHLLTAIIQKQNTILPVPEFMILEGGLFLVFSPVFKNRARTRLVFFVSVLKAT